MPLLSVSILSEVFMMSCPVLSVQLRTAMVKGETGTIALDVRAAVDKGVSMSATFMS